MDAPDRSRPGGIAGLLDLIEEHPGPLAYDWRARFGLPLSAPFDGTVSWHEAWLLTEQLLADPTSHLAAALAGWDYPASREALALADLWDLTVAVNTDKRKRGKAERYVRPFPLRDKARSTKPQVSQDAVRAALAARGHQPRKEGRRDGR
ncbi:hypothetical protein [Glycomyces sp. NPDC048151]|uniref:hypothetical protein n=1 Tax=Glycomyces sp. NPDC048151 TaxID=3364002 RepID=UPI00371B512E